MSEISGSLNPQAVRISPEWQPIETAPKDGTRVLVCGPRRGGGQYIDVTGWPAGWDGKWPVAWMDYAAGDPTHWMSLPEPPHPLPSFTGGGG